MQRRQDLQDAQEETITNSRDPIRFANQLSKHTTDYPTGFAFILPEWRLFLILFIL